MTYQGKSLVSPQDRGLVFFESQTFKGIWILALSGACIALSVLYFMDPEAATPDFMKLLCVLASTLFWFGCWYAVDGWKAARAL